LYRVIYKPFLNYIDIIKCDGSHKAVDDIERYMRERSEKERYKTSIFYTDDIDYLKSLLNNMYSMLNSIDLTLSYQLKYYTSKVFNKMIDRYDSRYIYDILDSRFKLTSSFNNINKLYVVNKNIIDIDIFNNKIDINDTIKEIEIDSVDGNIMFKDGGKWYYMDDWLAVNIIDYNYYKDIKDAKDYVNINKYLYGNLPLQNSIINISKMIYENQKDIIIDNIDR